MVASAYLPKLRILPQVVDLSYPKNREGITSREDPASGAFPTSMNFGQICHTPLGEDSFAHGDALFRDEAIHCSINFLRGLETKMM